jgi:glycosyltransferase involved in cell wall biosynthesis
MTAKILHLWVGDSPQKGGGGAGAMYRLHSNLRGKGLDSRILCEGKSTTDPYVFTKPPINRAERLLKACAGRMGLNDIHRISSWQVGAHEQFRQADVVNFQGIHGGFISYLALPRLTAQKPAVFTLRDLWCLTGHCTVSFDCERWKTGCGQCPYLWSHPPVQRDATAWEWKLKDWAYGRSRLTMVAVSRWLAEQARQSMLGRFEIHCIPDGVDIDWYRPIEKELARAALGIPKKARVLMFSAVDLHAFGKGADLLIKAAASFPAALKKDILLLTMGKNGQSLADQTGIAAVDLGYVANDRFKALAFSAADLFVFPSRGEALGQVVLESLACGTPVVAQNLGPLPEMVRPGVTGLLAERENPADLARQIVHLLEDDRLRERCGKNGRQMVVEEFSTELETHRYIELYARMLAGNAGGGKVT